MPRRWITAVALLLGVAACWELSQGAYIRAKAVLAQTLISRAWTRTDQAGHPVRPWPWADTWPVARLDVPGEALELFVLAGASGRTLAFGPGHVDGTAMPGESGNVVISGHRDTHFRFVRRLAVGSRLALRTVNGTSRDYEVQTMEIVDRSETRVLQPAGEDRLTLITCYPFDALVPGGPLRYVVVARRI
jgi:sortase A